MPKKTDAPAPTPETPAKKQPPVSLSSEHLLPFERRALEKAEGRGSVTERLSDALEGVLEEDDPEAPAEPATSEDSDDEDELEIPDEESEESVEDEDDDSEDTDDEPSPSAKGKKWKLKANGQEEEVDEPELLRRAAAGTDYTRKTQELAEQRKAAAAAAAETRAAREQYIERIEMMEAALDEQHGAEPDWTELERTNPTLYQAEWIRWSRVKDAKSKLQAEKAAQQQKQQEELQAQRAQRAEAERTKLFAAIPELADAAKGPEYAKQVVAYADKTYGFDENYIGSVTDHRFMLILDKARKYDELMEKGGSKVKGQLKTAPVLKPGTSKVAAGKPSAKQEIARRKKALARTGSERDALAIIDMMDFD